MLVKLNYTVDKDFKVGFRILNQIINDPTIISTATLQNNLVTQSAHASLTTGLDYVNCSVIRVNTLTSCVSNYAQPTNGYYSSAFTIRQTVYDTTSTYFYIQVADTTAGAGGQVFTNAKIIIGQTISSGSFNTATSMSLASASLSSVGGTQVVLNSAATGYYSYPSQPWAASAIGYSQIRCFWFYVTDTCFIFALTHQTSAPLGFGSTYNSTSNYSGPWIFSQYSRFDYFNTNQNGVIPYLMTNSRGNDGFGFGYSTDWDSVHHVNYAPRQNIANPPFIVQNLVSALPYVGTSWPLVYQQQVNWGPGIRYDDQFALTASGTNGVTRANSTANPVLFTTVSTRYPSADLATTAFAMLPILWRATQYGNTGGNTSAQSGVYLFNGDYFPGDEYTNNGIRYIIWPVYAGYSQRIGLAIPKV